MPAASAKALRALLVSCAFVVLLAGCEGSGGAQAGDGGKQTTVSGATGRGEETTAAPEGAAEARAGDGGAVARAGNAVAKAGDGAQARAGDAAAKAGGEQKQGEASKPGEAVLRLAGDEGTAFSGECVIGDERKDLDGRVPDRLAFRLDGRDLRCEIRKGSRGTLKTILVAGEDRYVQSTGGRWAFVNLAYSGRGFSSSVNSATPSGSSRQSVVSSSSSSE